MKRTIRITILLIVIASCSSLFAQPVWTNADYQKALWMTTRFYGAQRSGDNNWTLANHLPGGVNAALTGRAFRADYNTTDGVDLSGGWHDCGDHVKFGQTQFYSAYMLLKGYAEFPTGYDDRYSFAYDGYKSSNQWNFEGTGHDPNCIPDVLDEMKHETDFLIKCTPNASTFWYQVGNGGCPGDHCRWETAVKMQTNDVNNGGNNDNGTPGARRPSCKNPNDGSMASFAGAALALMARVYAPYDAAYANLCLTHALNAYNYARTRLGSTTGSCFGGFYGANRDSRDAFVCLCAELFWTTGTAAYQTEAYSHEAGVAFNAGWSFDYANNGEIGLYNLAKLGNASATTRFNNRITGHFLAAGSRNAAGVYTAYGTWGRLRYNGNAAFLIALYSKLNNNTTAAVINAIHNDVDYIMGKNGSKRSYIVGYSPAAGGPYLTPLYPHHRNAYLRDDNPTGVISIPAKNQQLGALVGGQRDGSYNDDRGDYVNSEVCVDYNAGLVGALGFINARLAPVTISCGGNACRKPELGANLSTCSGTTLPTTLNANAGAPGGAISYRWYTWNGTTKTVISGQTGQTYSASAIGGYIVERDSAYTGGPCTKSDTVYITNTLSKPTLGADPAALCSPAFLNLTPSNAASFPVGTTWQWYNATALAGPYNIITGATSSTLSNVRIAAYYRVVATAGSCTNADTIRITSNLPTPVDGCRSGTGTVNLSITNPGLNGTNYNWYSAATGGTLLATGTTTFTTPSISTTTTYYVQDMGAASGSVGPVTDLGSGTNWGVNTGNRLLFTASQNFTLNSFKIPFNMYGDGTGTVTIEIRDNTNTVRATYTTQSITTTGSGTQFLTFTFSPGVLIDQAAWGSDLKMNISAETLNGDPLWNNVSTAAYPYNSSPSGIVSITGKEGGNGAANEYMYFYDWQISTGTPCDRLPVTANISGSCSLPVELINFYALNNSDHVSLSWATAWEKDNDYFHLERSEDGVTFTSVTKVKGAENSETVKTYSYVDYETAYGKVYYRIAQYDIDGTLTYSEVVTIERIDDTYVSVLPNPFSNSTNILVRSSVQSKMQLKVTDLSGAIRLTTDDYSTNEFISIGDDLAKGVYILQATFNNSIYTVKMR